MAQFGNNNAVHLEAAQKRADAIRAQLDLAISFCHLVPTEIDYGHIDDARSLIQKAQRVAEIVTRHIREESHVPSQEVAKLKEQLRKLELLIVDSQRKLAA